jgi:peptidoglycan hydrolase-like protein with peptidoglycan-binding domain
MSVDSGPAAEHIGAGASTDPEHADGRPPTARFTAVRIGGHTGFDRVVLEFAGGPPGYHAEYVDEVTEDGSGAPIPLRGRAFLQVSAFPASAFDDNGNGAPPALPVESGLAALRDLAHAGDFEAVVSLGIGLAARTPFLVRRLSGPARIVIDVAHQPPGTGNELLRRGDRGAAVATWQWRLNLAVHRGIAVDEDFGPATEAATTAFQQARGLTADGVVGPRSRAEMERVLGL